MFDLIARLRQRPPEKRRRIALFVALGTTLLIAIFWFVSLFFGTFRPRPAETPVEDSTPAEGLWLQMKGGIQALWESVHR